MGNEELVFNADRVSVPADDISCGDPDDDGSSREGSSCLCTVCFQMATMPHFILGIFYHNNKRKIDLKVNFLTSYITQRCYNYREKKCMTWASEK